MATTMVPGTHTGYNRTDYLDTVEAPTYQGMEFTNTIREYDGDINNQGNIRKHARSLGTTLGQTAPGTALTYNVTAGTPVTVDPVGRYNAAAWSANERAQVDFDLSSGLDEVLRKGLSETIDQAGLASVASLTQSISQASVDAAMWRQAVGRLMQNTNGQYGPGMGNGNEIRAIFSPTQYPNVMAIPEFNDADVRGDSENPRVKGIFTRGGGVNVRFSTVVTQDANGWHNPLYVLDTFIVGWNERIRGFEEQSELEIRLILFANLGFAVLHDLRGIDLRLTASAL